MATQRIDPFLFLVVTMWVFASTLFLLNAAGFVPYYIDGSAPTVSDTTHREYLTDADVNTSPVTTNPVQTPPHTSDMQQPLPGVITEVPDVAFLPERIRIPDLDKELVVVNPVKNDVATLDRELLDAVVRYPESGLLNEDGNIFIFGHSSHLRTVHNPLFKAFNGIETLTKGALIQLLAEGRVYVYQVTKVQKVSANSALVDLRPRPGERILTLSTCNSFGEKSDRFVVTAAFSVAYSEDNIDNK